jgi:hypothetical protein
MTVECCKNKITIVGHVKPSTLLNKFKKNVDKKAQMWLEEKKKEFGNGGKGGGN